MTKKERIQAAIRGEKPDKMPYSFWTHMPGTDLDPEAISQKTYEFYKKYDFDFVKTMNNGMYAIEDFGCTVDYSEIVKGGVAKVVSTPISCAADWRKLTVCPCTQGSNARELRHLQLVLEKLKGEDIDAIKAAQEELTKKFYDVSAKVYQANPPQGGAPEGAPQGDPNTPPADGDNYYNGEVH